MTQRRKHAPVTCTHSWEEVRAAGGDQKLYGWHCSRCGCHRPVKVCPKCREVFGKDVEIDVKYCSEACRPVPDWVKKIPKA